MRDMMLVLNLDDVSSRAVTRKLRSEHVLCKIIPGDSTLEEIQALDPQGLLLAGAVRGEVPEMLDKRLLESGLPILALGDASLALLRLLGGDPGEKALFGAIASLEYRECRLTADVEDGERMIQCAREITLSKDLVSICKAQEIVIGFAHQEKPLFGVQFEMEQNDPEGSQLLRNFAMTICGCTAWWNDETFIRQTVDEISMQVGTGTAVCAMTGGLDSGVSALLAHKAIGNRLKCIFVDTGLLRDNEGDDFMAFYHDTLGLDVIRVHAQERFLEALKGLTDPVEKRKAIADTLQQVLDEEKSRLGSFQALIRGTSYSDVMFDAGARRPTLSRDVLMIEPVRELFKEEIRRIGDCLGMPSNIISRQTFPGSGLALRILGEVTLERLKVLRRADAVLSSEISKAGLNKKLWQYFAVLMPMPGDASSSAICIRAVNPSERSLTYAARLPYDLMENVVDRILRNGQGVSRVVYDLTPSSNYVAVEWQ